MMTIAFMQKGKRDMQPTRTKERKEKKVIRSTKHNWRFYSGDCCSLTAYPGSPTTLICCNLFVIAAPHPVTHFSVCSLFVLPFLILAWNLLEELRHWSLVSILLPFIIMENDSSSPWLGCPEDGAKTHRLVHESIYAIKAGFDRKWLSSMYNLPVLISV